MRRLPAPTANQGLIWLDGESLCVTPEFQAELGGRIPDWLILDNLPARPGSLEMHHQVVLDDQRRACLVRRRQRRFWSGAWAWLRGRRRVVSPELEQAARIFGLERSGIQTPRLLAFGQRWLAPCWLESFLLTEAIPEASGVSESHSGSKPPIAARSALP